MVFRYLIYRTDYDNTIIRESPTNTSTGGTEQALYTNFLIPKTQPLYLWKVIVISSTVVPNTETYINLWLAHITPSPSPTALVTFGQLTGITQIINNNIDYISGVTDMVIEELPYLSAGNYNLPSTFIDNGDGSATIGAVDVLLYPTSGYTELIALCTAIGGTFIFTDNSEEYIVARYISGNTAILEKLTNRNGYNNSNIVPIFTVWRLKNIISYFTHKEIGRGLGNKTQESIVRTEPYLRAYKQGLVISEVQAPFNRRIQVTGAEVYSGAIKTDVLPYDSSINSLVMVYHSGGTMTYQQQSGTSYNNIQYDDGIDLVTIPSGKFTVRWWYRPINHKKILFYMFGSVAYDYIAQAYEAQPRLDLPIILKNSAMLIGRTIIKYSATTGITETAFDIASYGEAPIIVHNSTVEKEGSPLAIINNEFYHLSQAEAAAAILVPTIYQTLTGFTAYTTTTGLQQITQVNAQTNIESTFNGGLRTHKIRPTGNTATAIQVRKANGTTVIINVDTVSGLTGFGTIAPKTLVHTYGIDNSGGMMGFNTQSNAVTVDGALDVDKDINWSEDGTPKWLAETYRNENSQFWYLYNVDAENAPLTITETGRIGINKNTNVMDYHVAEVVGSGLNDLGISGVYEQNYNTVYEIEIVDITGITDTYHWRKSLDDGFTYDSFSSTSGVTLTPVELEFGVQLTFENLTGHTVGNKFRFTAFTQIPQATLSIAPMGVAEVLHVNDYTPSAITYNDITALANGGVYENEFNVFNTGTGGTIQAFYWGMTIKNNAMFFNLKTFGAGITLVTEYWNGISWTALNFVNYDYIDGTVNLTQSGRIIWSPLNMNDWIRTYLPNKIEDGYDLYWMRIRTSTNPTIAPFAKSLSVGNDKRLNIYGSFNDYNPNYYVDSLGRVNIGGGIITGKNVFQINKTKIIEPTSSSPSLVEFDSEDSSAVDLKIKLASNDNCGAGMVLLSSRGTLLIPLNAQNNDEVGHLNFRTVANSVGLNTSQIKSIYSGNGTTKYGDLIFGTASGAHATEKVRITSSGTTGFGISSGITAVVDIKAGTTSISPLKFHSGTLLSVPQVGAVEFLGNNWYGTTSGSTRKTFAFLESPQFTSSPNLPVGTTLNSQNLCNYILNSGGTNNTLKLNTSTFNSYTGNTLPIINIAITGATNGLTKVGAHGIKFGGLFSENTTVGHGSYDFTLCAKRFRIASANGTDIFDDSGNDIQIYSSGGTTTLKGMTNGGAESMRFVISDTQATYTDSRVTPRGVEYNADYSSTFTVRSLVDKAYVDTISTGISVKGAVLVTTTTNIALNSGTTIIDGITMSNGDRVLVKNQISGATNGIYDWHSSGMTRSSDFDGTPVGEVINGSYMTVTSGNTNKNTSWILTTPNPIVVDVTDLTFVLFSNIAGVVAGNGICVTQGGGNNIISAKLASNCGLCSDASGLRINTGIAGNGICYNAGSLSVKGSDIAGNSLSWTGTQLAVNTTGGTLNTVLNLKLPTSTFCTYTGTTATDISNKLLKTTFCTYTGTTVPATYLNKIAFNTYSGTTVPATYLDKITFNSYTGATSTAIDLKADISGETFTGIPKAPTAAVNTCTTQIATTAFVLTQAGVAIPLMNNVICAIGSSNLYSRQDHIHPSDTSRLTTNAFGTYSGTTAPNQFLGKTAFNTYSGTTVPNTYYNKTQINAYTGNTQTAIGLKLDKSIYEIYTGTTAPAIYLGKTAFNTYSGTTIPNTYYNKTQINIYTGATKTELNLTITGATNLGIGNIIATKSGRNITHKSLIAGTGIAINNTANDITICSTVATVGADKQITYNRGGLVTGTTGLIYCYACDALQFGIGSSALGSLSVAQAGGQALGLRSFAHGLTNYACAPNSIVLGGTGNTICIGALRSAIIGSCGIILTGATYNDYTAVGNLAIWKTPLAGDISVSSTLFWNPNTKQVRALKLTGGSDCYFYTEKTITNTTNSTSCIMYLSGTPWTFAAGRYQVDFNAQLGHVTAAPNACAKFTIDGVGIGNSFDVGSLVANYLISISASKDITFTAGCHCLAIYYWGDGSSCACMPYGMIRAKRIT
jgi:nitrogen fixation protein FixH